MGIYIKSVENNIPEIGKNISEDYLYEFCRFSNSLIPPAVSITGSVASQEIIKLITYKFYTVNNTVIFDMIHNCISIFKF